MKRLLVIFFFSASLALVSFGQANVSGEVEYESWMAPFRSSLTHSWRIARGNDTTIETPFAVISVVIEPDQTDPSPFRGRTWSGFELGESGEVKWFAHNPFGTKGSCCRQMSPNDVRRAKESLEELPPDDHRLPPNGRRLLIQWPIDNAIEARVFDLAFLPDRVIDFLRLTKAGFKTYVPSFAAETSIGEPFDLRGFVAAGDGRFALSTRGNGTLRLRRFLTAKDASLEFEEVALPQNAFVSAGLTLSPDESTVIAAGYGTIVFYNTRNWRVVRQIEDAPTDKRVPNYSRHHFIDGGKYLLFETGEFGMRVFDTATWRDVAKPNWIPVDAQYYYDSLNAQRALIVSSDHLFLRNNKQMTELMSLEKDKFETASFSLDGSLLAVATVGILRSGDNAWRHARIRVWDARNGKFIDELRPYERDSCEEVDGIVWTSDGRYLLAATKPDGFFSNRNIGIWDVRLGRQVGDLQGCVSDIFGVGVLAGDSRVVAGCGNKILTWNLVDSLAEIHKFRETANK